MKIISTGPREHLASTTPAVLGVFRTKTGGTTRAGRERERERAYRHADSEPARRIVKRAPGSTSVDFSRSNAMQPSGPPGVVRQPWTAGKPRVLGGSAASTSITIR